jgi:hypothetical protein
MGKKTETTTRKSERLAAANAAAAAAAFNAAAAAAATAAAAASSTATATDALPPVILERRFEGYMSPGYVTERERDLCMHFQALCKRFHKDVREDFAHWQDEETDKLPGHLMRRQKMLDEVRSMRTDDPSETAAAAAAAAADTSAVAAAVAAATAAADATTNAAANSSSETAATAAAAAAADTSAVAAAAATATDAAAATTDAAATAAAREIARLQHELGEMTDLLMTVSAPKAFYPEWRDPQEVDKWDTWCNSIPWGPNCPAPTPTQQICYTDNHARR